MIDLFMGAVEPPKNPLIEPKPIVIEQPAPELTVEEKIASNYYNCDESIQWIRADNAECLTKGTRYRASESGNATERTNTQVAPQNTATAPAGWYEEGSCTYGAWLLAPWVGRWSDAKTWGSMARADGRIVNSIPIVGSVFVDEGGKYGHVGVVISVSGSTVTVKDMNYQQKYVYTVRTVPTSSYTYIYP